jgi:hypothetical protein
LENSHKGESKTISRTHRKRRLIKIGKSRQGKFSFIMTKIFKNIWGLSGILMAMMLSAVKPELSHRVLPDPLDLQLIVCDESPDYSGYATIGSFLEDFTENKTTTLLMCPGILYKTVEALELPETQNMLSISCVDASQTCEWKAAGSHLIVKPRDATVVHVEGVTFTSSTESSVIIEVEPLTPMHVNFVDCVWKVRSRQEFQSLCYESLIRPFIKELTVVNTSDIAPPCLGKQRDSDD